jgi:hypothetical protein
LFGLFQDLGFGDFSEIILEKSKKVDLYLQKEWSQNRELHNPKKLHLNRGPNDMVCQKSCTITVSLFQVKRRGVTKFKAKQDTYRSDKITLF